MKLFYLFIIFSIFSFNLFAQSADVQTATTVKSDIIKIYDSQIECQPITNIEKEESIMDDGLLIAFLIVLLGGFLTSLTPCAFPVILISLPPLMKEGGTKLHKFLISLTYVLGIATMYSTLGVVTASTGKAFGTLMQNKFVILGFVIFFIIMGLASLGAFIIQLPSGLTMKASKASSGAGFIKSYVSGLFLGILAAPCVGPVLASILAYIAQTGDVLLGFLLLTTFAFGMGIIILIIGTFSPNWKSGSWMEKVNTTFGILLFTAALYFLKDAFSVILTPFNKLYEVINYNSLIFATISVALIVGGYFIGAYKFEEMFMISLKEKIRKLTSVLVISLGLFMLAGVFIFIEGKSHINWIKTEKEAIEIAKKENKPIFIDFSADWCTACKELEKYTYSNSAVAKYINENYIPVYIDCTKTEDDENCKQTNDKYEIDYQLPSVVFIDYCGRYRKDLTLKGFEGSKDFLKRLKKAK